MWWLWLECFSIIIIIINCYYYNFSLLGDLGSNPSFACQKELNSISLYVLYDSQGLLTWHSFIKIPVSAGACILQISKHFIHSGQLRISTLAIHRLWKKNCLNDSKVGNLNNYTKQRYYQA